MTEISQPIYDLIEVNVIDIKTAVASARAFAAETLDVGDFLLEEVKTDNGHFQITLSFPARGSFVVGRREYKSFDIDKDTGEVHSMVIRA